MKFESKSGKKFQEAGRFSLSGEEKSSFLIGQKGFQLPKGQKIQNFMTFLEKIGKISENGPFYPLTFWEKYVILGELTGKGVIRKRNPNPKSSPTFLKPKDP